MGGQLARSLELIERNVTHATSIINFMKQDFITLDSDGSDGHPRKYGTFPKFFHEYVREKHVMPMGKAVQRSRLLIRGLC